MNNLSEQELREKILEIENAFKNPTKKILSNFSRIETRHIERTYYKLSDLEKFTDSLKDFALLCEITKVGSELFQEIYEEEGIYCFVTVNDKNGDPIDCLLTHEAFVFVLSVYAQRNNKELMSAAIKEFFKFQELKILLFEYQKQLVKMFIPDLNEYWIWVFRDNIDFLIDETVVVRKNEEKPSKEVKYDEKYIELKFKEFLISNGIDAENQVRCKIGIADITTKNAIFEIKKRLTLDSVRDAVAQIIAYREYINKKANLYIVGEEHKPNTKQCLSYTKKFGITLIHYDRENDKFSKIGG